MGQTPPATHVPHPLSVGPRGVIPKQWTGGLQREGLKLSVPHEGGALGLKGCGQGSPYRKGGGPHPNRAATS